MDGLEIFSGEWF